MTTIDLATLAMISGGMRWDDFPRSPNVENVAHLPRYKQRNYRAAPGASIPKLVRTPGDLASQAGLDNLDRLGKRRR